MPLTQDGQLDFSAGMVRAVARHLIPPNGFYAGLNALIDDDRGPYRRGGSEILTTGGAFGSSGLRAIWDGFLHVGARTLVANPDDFGVLASDDLSVVNLGGAGLSEPKRMVELGGIVFVPGGAMYAGSRKTAAYNTGTVTTTNGSKTVTGSGTTWNTLVDAGMLFRVGSERYYVVASVDSTTQITLRDPYEGSTGGGKAYSLNPLGDASSAPYKTSDVLAVVANRLLVCQDDTAFFSEGPSETGVLRPHSFGANDFWKVPQGVRILAAEQLRGTALLFTTDGVWAIRNMAFDLIDPVGGPQQALEPLTRDIVVWGQAGIASWGNSLVVPAVDGVYLVDGVSQAEPVSRSVAPLIREYVQAGYKPGGAAVFRSHLFLPVLDSANVVVDLLVCRLDRPVSTPFGKVRPWTQMADSGAQVAALAVRVGQTTRQPVLLAAGRQTTSRVLKLSKFFEPAAAVKNDHDGTTHKFRLVTRDIATGPLNLNHVKRMRLRYELVDAASDNPTISAYYSVGVLQGNVALWDVAQWDVGLWGDPATAEDVALAGVAPEDDGRKTYVWQVNARARFIRYRIESSSPCAKLIVRSVEHFVRQGSRRR